MIINQIFFVTSGVVCTLRGPRPNVTSIDSNIYEVDIFSVFDDIATNLKNDFSLPQNNSVEPNVIKNIIYLTSEDTNQNSNLNIKGLSKKTNTDQECNSTLLIIFNIATLALSFINLAVLLSSSKTYIKYRIPPETLLHDERSITPCSSQSRSI